MKTKVTKGNPIRSELKASQREKLSVNNDTKRDFKAKLKQNSEKSSSKNPPVKNSLKKASLETSSKVIKSAVDSNKVKASVKSRGKISSNWKSLKKSLGLSEKAKPPRPKNGTIDVSSAVDPQEETTADVWFDGIDDVLIQVNHEEKTENSLVKTEAFSGITRFVAMDCEMVGVGEQGQDSILARVSIVNQFGHVLLDSYVKPTDQVTDYRTAVSGIRESDIVNGEEFFDVQKKVSDIITGRIVVGHALHNDFKCLLLDHPSRSIRDTSRYRPFRKLFQGQIPSLKRLCNTVLNVQVQQGEHSSVQDAQAAMKLYVLHKKQWEHEVRLRRALCRKRTTNS